MEGLLFSDPFKMEPIGKEWGAHLVGGYLCAQPLLPVLSLSIVMCRSLILCVNLLNKPNEDHMVILP